MKIMLCGSADTRVVYNDFEDIVLGFSSMPISFLNGSHTYENSLLSSSVANSRASIHDADICVFVINQAYGTITWNVEFREALRGGKPFIILCEKETMSAYRAFRKHGGDSGTFKELYDLIEMIEQERELTICEYNITEFRKELREQLGKIYELSVKTYTRVKQREIAAYLLKSGAELSGRDIDDLKEILVDEYENKKTRKDILQRLSEYHCLDKDTVLDLIGSQEQGVSRLTVDNLDQLMRPAAYDLAFLKECVAAVNGHDDTGTERRLVSKILDIDVKNGVTALLELKIIEIGVKRRLTTELIRHKDQIVDSGVIEEALILAKECHKKAEDKGWRDDCLQLIKELEDLEKNM